MKENYEKTLEEFKENSGDGYYPNEIMVRRLMTVEKLDRLNDGLKDISFELAEIANSLSILANCVTYTQPMPEQKECHVFRTLG